MLCIRLLVVASLSGLTVLAISAYAHAQNPFSSFRLFKQVEADLNNAYPLTKTNGPWMIMAATFAARGGRDAAESERLRQEAFGQAQELVHELRKEHKLEAFTFARKIDLEDAVEGRGIDPRGRPRRMRYQHKPSTHEIAVLVGNYSAIDSPEAERDLKIVKDCDPKSLDLEALQKQNRRTYQQLVAYRLSQKTVTADQFKSLNPANLFQTAKNVQINNATRQSGPMGSAFVTRNPLLPQEDARTPHVDKVVYEMNKDVKHSLLNCPGKYSVQVATFTGAVIMDQKKIRELENGQTHMDSRLDEAALRAHELTEALRLKGYEAYEFHDRGASIVAVGSFDSAGAQRPDGKLEMNPAMLQVVRTFGPDPLTGRPKAVMNIPLDLHPAPVLVPQRSVSSDYIGAGLFGWR
jgi:hypothetical protein